MTEQARATETVKRGSYKPLWWLIALCAFPYIAGTLWYQYRDVLPGGETINYGQLVHPAQPVKDVDLTLLDGTQKPLAEFRKKWLMLYILDGECTEDCLKNIYYMRQMRKAMAQDRFRISRLVVLDNPALMTDELRRVVSEYPDMYVATVTPGQQQELYASVRSGAESIYRKIMLIDPLGNFMMQYPKEPLPDKVLKDIKRLLKVSRIG